MINLIRMVVLYIVKGGDYQVDVSIGRTHVGQLDSCLLLEILRRKVEWPRRLDQEGSGSRRSD